MKRIAMLIAFAALLNACGGGSDQAAQPPYATITYSTTYTAYDADGPGGNNPRTYNIRITAPDLNGVFPIGVLLSGTSDTDGSLGLSVFATQLAQRGVIAAEVGYNNGTSEGCGCDGMGPGGACGNPFIRYYDKAQAIFDNGNADSAIRRLVTATSTLNAQASLAKGVVVIAFSQGTVVGRQADNWLRPYIRGAYFLGSGNRPRGGPVCGRQDWYCNESTYPGVIPGNIVRFMTGEQDTFFSRPQNDAARCDMLSAEDTRTQNEKISGCTSPTDTCELIGGGGWRVIRNSLVEDGIADHAYFNGDSKWRDGRSDLTMGWTLADNLDWLISKLGAPGPGAAR